jgi:hypothetical protein
VHLEARPGVESLLEIEGSQVTHHFEFIVSLLPHGEFWTVQIRDQPGKLLGVRRNQWLDALAQERHGIPRGPDQRSDRLVRFPGIGIRQVAPERFDPGRRQIHDCGLFLMQYGQVPHQGGRIGVGGNQEPRLRGQGRDRPSVPLEWGQPLAGAYVVSVDDPRRLARAEQRPAVRRESQENVWGAARETEAFLAGGNFPRRDRVLSVDRGQRAAVGREGQATDNVLARVDSAYQPAGGQVPKRDWFGEWFLDVDQLHALDLRA